MSEEKENKEDVVENTEDVTTEATATATKKSRTKKKPAPKKRKPAETEIEAYEQAKEERGVKRLSDRVKQAMEKNGVLFVQANPKHPFQCFYCGAQQLKIINYKDGSKNIIEPVVETVEVQKAMMGNVPKLLRITVAEGGLEKYNSPEQVALREKLSFEKRKRHENMLKRQEKLRKEAEEASE